MRMNAVCAILVLTAGAVGCQSTNGSRKLSWWKKSPPETATANMSPALPSSGVVPPVTSTPGMPGPGAMASYPEHAASAVGPYPATTSAQPHWPLRMAPPRLPPAIRQRDIHQPARPVCRLSLRTPCLRSLDHTIPFMAVAHQLGAQRRLPIRQHRTHLPVAAEHRAPLTTLHPLWLTTRTQTQRLRQIAEIATRIATIRRHPLRYHQRRQPAMTVAMTGPRQPISLPTDMLRPEINTHQTLQRIRIRHNLPIPPASRQPKLQTIATHAETKTRGTINRAIPVTNLAIPGTIRPASLSTIQARIHLQPALPTTQRHHVEIRSIAQAELPITNPRAAYPVLRAAPASNRSLCDTAKQRASRRLRCGSLPALADHLRHIQILVIDTARIQALDTKGYRHAVELAWLPHGRPPGATALPPQAAHRLVRLTALA